MSRRDFPSYIQTQTRTRRQVAGIHAAIKSIEDSPLIRSGDGAPVVGDTDGNVFGVFFHLDGHHRARLGILAGILQKLAHGQPEQLRIGLRLEREIEERTSFETRVTILGHVQRGGTPVAYDRVLATRFGVSAMDAAAGGRFGMLVGLRGTEIVEVPLEQALEQPKLLDPKLYETAELFFG